jgi:hypothetical protein
MTDCRYRTDAPPIQGIATLCCSFLDFALQRLIAEHLAISFTLAAIRVGDDALGT